MLSLCAVSSALLLPSPAAVQQPAAGAALSRRGLLHSAGTAAGAFAVFAAGPAFAAEPEFNRMGGLLEPFIDTQKG